MSGVPGLETAIAELGWGGRLVALVLAGLVAAGGGAIGAQSTTQRITSLEAVVDERGNPADWRQAVESRLGSIEGKLEILVQRGG